jgi:60 kDa SS-A/Ro ribonucleoprotein
MAKINVKAPDYRIDREHRLAGGYGPSAAKQDPEALLRRAVMACLLWENLAYESGKENAEGIAALVSQVPTHVVAQIAIEAREKQKLRHVPLLLIREMARSPEHRWRVGDLIPRICTRADMLTDLLALYWKEGKRPISAQMKKGLAAGIAEFGEYALSKYNRDGAVKFRDILFLCHATPRDDAQAALWKRLVDGKLETPDTWEVALSSSQGANKKEAWTRLIEERRLGGLALLRNLRNAQQAGVDYQVVAQGLQNLNAEMLLPLNFLAAQRAAPDYTREIEQAMLRGYEKLPKLPGWTVFILDTSGSMNAPLSEKSTFTRLDAGAAMMMLAAERAERVSLYVTAGDDSARKHATAKVKPVRGFGLLDAAKESRRVIGGGGIFTRQALEWVKGDLKGEVPDRILVFSDSQDCDRDRSTRLPVPFGKRNYIVDVSSHAHGINYDGVWDAEISGWSEHVISYIAALEGLEATAEGEERLQ